MRMVKLINKEQKQFMVFQKRLQFWLMFEILLEHNSWLSCVNNFFMIIVQTKPAEIHCLTFVTLYHTPGKKK